MNWLIDLFTQGSIAHTIVVYCVIIVLGMSLGKVKVRGISLGATFVLFVGLLLGHFEVHIDPSLLEFMKTFGLILFIFSIGLQVGPGFFSSFKQGGIRLNLLACLMVFLGVGTTLFLFYILHGRVSLPMLVGVMSGSVTATPGLAAAEEALDQLHHLYDTPIEPLSLGYAVAYPIGVLGTILVMMILRVTFRIKPHEEEQALELRTDIAQRPDILTFKITNAAIDGLSVTQMKERFGHQVIVTRVFDGEKVFIPKADTLLHTGYIILVITKDKDRLELEHWLGESVAYEWKDDERNLVSRRIVVTQGKVNGKTLRDLHLRPSFNVNVSRINRAGIDLIARPDLALQLGDKVMVVGPAEGVKKVEEILGNTLKRLDEPHIVTIFLGILIGIIVGCIPIFIPGMPTPAKLGLAGGPLIVAILLGRFGYKLRLITYTTQSANLMLRELGLCIFLASVGLTAGKSFMASVFSPAGLLWLCCAIAITMLPALIVGIVSRCMKMNFFTICGLIAGAHTNAPTLAYTAAIGDNDESAVVYSTVYPLVIFLRILLAQGMVLFLAV